jgi:hypothetical protein
MKKTSHIIWVIIALVILFNCSKKNDDQLDMENNCPAINISTPDILGDWIFTGTERNGQLIIEGCDERTKLTVTNTQFIWGNYSGTSCGILTVIPTCYSIENDTVYYFDDLGEKTGFYQTIKVLNNKTLILENPSSSNIIATENYERL